ncbi:MAG: 4-hydroxyphenylpyruvate dioxygenase [Catalinimonas sp.]
MLTPTTSKQPQAAATVDFLPLLGTDHVELYVGNARQAAHYYQTAFGFQPLAHAGLATGRTNLESYVVQQDKIRLVLTSPLRGGTDVGRHHDRRGDAVRTVALWVEDAAKAFEETVARGARPFQKPTEAHDKGGTVRTAGIHTYGDTVHLFVERADYDGVFLPGYAPWTPHYRPASVGLRHVDHMVGNVGWGEMNYWVDFYARVMGFTQLVSFDDEDISTEYTALMSKVMSNGNGRIKFPINEPAEGRKRSQIEEFLEFHGGPGVQHVALATDDIVATVTALRDRGVEFLRVPDTYYDDLRDRVGAIDEEIDGLRPLGVLVDRDDEGYLLQIFTKPVGPRPTMFFEVIQRKGARSFGKGNFKALFEAIEREQALRGTL